ncbi:signal recognition particle receptor subunit beta [Culicoides brevitarsis]|uniref:signal recognition particle receptor subunit beta n=1 Tax=Culicoides brevitarsis TaxID=469753 RepID=UPI00307B57C3
MDAKPKQCSARAASVSLSEFNFGPVIVALLVLFFTLLALLIFKRRRAARTDVLLAGVCDSGKTQVFSQLVYSEPRETYTSMKENVDRIGLNKTVFRLVDVPGHERVRQKFFDQYKKTARLLVFVVDSATLQKDIRDVADYLYTILADSSVSSTPVVVACNKQDLALAKGATAVKGLLEKELNLIRVTRTSQLQSVDNSNSGQVFLGKEGKDFGFSQLSQQVEFVECSAKDGNLKELEDLMKKLV